MSRKFKLFMLACLAMLTLASSLPAQAGSATEPYAVGGGVLTVYPANPVDGKDTVNIGGVNFSGTTQFTGAGTTSVTIKVKDTVGQVTGTPTFIIACQDIDDDSSCGEGPGDDPTNPNQVNEPSVAGCAGATTGSALSLPGAKKGSDITVFILGASTGCEFIIEPDDENGPYFGTNGTVTINWA